MAQSLTKLLVHFVFHIKNCEIREAEFTELYAYIGAIIKDNDSLPLIINGVANHLHILCVLSKNIALAKLVENVKRHSSRWIKTKDEQYYQNFAWRAGYGAFSVSPSIGEKTRAYIANQAEHHRKLSFREEYLQILNKHNIAYDEKYLWSD